MGSRLRENVKQIFECFCEVAATSADGKQSWILQKYPESYNDTEVLKTVPKFAYPCEFENVVVQHFSFVLTSIDSKWTFGFCRHDPKTETALVILSALPWHETFYKLLNHIATLISGNNVNDLWKFLQDVYETSIPVSGATISIPLPDSKTVFVCQRPKQFQLPSIPENRNLTEYFSAIDPHNMMIIFASMLYERRIIFTSKRLSRLSACVQACNALIYPMIWQHIYIPVLPISLTDYLLAPMPFLIGVPTPILKKVHKHDLGEVVILNADNNTIETPFQDLDSLPQDVVSSLRKALRNRPTLLGDGVSRAFLRALVQLTAGYREALTLQQGQTDDNVRITFDQEAFVESRPASMQPFLRKMLELQIFQQFIEERLNMLNSGLGFSDEFEMEACNYSDKSGGKFMQQYREWSYTMRKQGSAFIHSVKDKVKDKGKDMKTAYKGLKWKGRSNRSANDLRFQKPRSAPSSPTSDRRPASYDSPSKSQSSHTPTTSYRKELRLRNSNVETSRKQYSPLNPSSSEETETPPERIEIDLMHELRDVIFPNIPPVNRNLKPVRSLDSLRPAWSGRLRHGPLPKNSAPYEHYEVPRLHNPKVYTVRTLSENDAVQSEKLSNNSNLNDPYEHFEIRFPKNSENLGSYEHYEIPRSHDPKINLKSHSEKSQLISLPKDKKENSLIDVPCDKKFEIHEFINPISSTPNSKKITNGDIEKSNKIDKLHSEDPFEIYENTDSLNTSICLENLNDPFDTSRVFNPFDLTIPLCNTTNTNNPSPLFIKNKTEFCSAPAKDQSLDLIRLDSTTSDEDFDPLLSKSSKLDSTNQMSQSMHIPEGLTNPLYPYFTPKQKTNAEVNHVKKESEKSGDTDLLQEYGLDFSKFNLSNNKDPAALSNNLLDCNNAFSTSFNVMSVKSQNNWTKFE